MRTRDDHSLKGGVVPQQLNLIEKDSETRQGQYNKAVLRQKNKKKSDKGDKCRAKPHREQECNQQKLPF